MISVITLLEATVVGRPVLQGFLLRSVVLGFESFFWQCGCGVVSGDQLFKALHQSQASLKTVKRNGSWSGQRATNAHWFSRLKHRSWRYWTITWDGFRREHLADLPACCSRCWFASSCKLPQKRQKRRMFCVMFRIIIGGGLLNVKNVLEGEQCWQSIHRCRFLRKSCICSSAEHFHKRVEKFEV